MNLIKLPGVTLRFFVVRELLSRIYALSSVKFPSLKLWLCKKRTNMNYEEERERILDDDVSMWLSLNIEQFDNTEYCS